MKFPEFVTVDCPACGSPITVRAYLKGDPKNDRVVTVNYDTSEAANHVRRHVEELTAPTGS